MTKLFHGELYLNIGYKYRDVLDDLAEVTGSAICIRNDNVLEIRQINNTNDTIDEEYFKDINVNFGKKYGPVNSIVLSRSESDNIFTQDVASIQANGLCEVKIKDNLIMNENNRSDYLPDLLQTLDGIEYYLNDYSSTGIMYYDFLDRYNVKIGENTYSCVMFNDEQYITQGLEEQIYTDEPEVAETDYTKADKTDMAINKTYIIVDKQNQTIESVVENVTTQNQKISQIEQDIDSIRQTVNDKVDYKRNAEGLTEIYLTEAGEAEILNLEVKGNKTYINNLFPSSNLYPSTGIYPNIK